MNNLRHAPPLETSLKPSSLVGDPVEERPIVSKSRQGRSLRGVRLLPKPNSKSIRASGRAHSPHTFFFVKSHSVISQRKRQDHINKANSHAQSVARQAGIQRLKGGHAARLVGGFSRRQPSPHSPGSTQSRLRSPNSRGASPRGGLGAFPPSRVRSRLASGSSPAARSGSRILRRGSPSARWVPSELISRTDHNRGRKELRGTALPQHISNPSGPIKSTLRLQAFLTSPTSFLDSGLIDPFANASTRMNKKMNGYLRFCKFYPVQ